MVAQPPNSSRARSSASLHYGVRRNRKPVNGPCYDGHHTARPESGQTAAPPRSPMFRLLNTLLDTLLLLALVVRETWRCRRPTPPVRCDGNGQIILAITNFLPDGHPIDPKLTEVLTFRGLFQRVLSVTVSGDRTAPAQSEPAPGIRYLDLPLHPASPWHRRGWRRAAALQALADARRGLEAAILAGEYGVITAHDPHLLGLLGVAMARRTGVPLVLHLNSNFDNKFQQTGKVSFPWARWRWLERRIEHFVMAQADVIVADRQYYRTCGFVPARFHSKYRAVGVFPPLVVDPAAGPSRAELLQRWGLPDRPVILYLGRLHPHKLAADLIPFAQHLATLRQDWTFVLAGDGPLRTEMEKAAQPLGDQVRFLGNQPSGMVADLLRLCTFVVATHGGVTLVEAATAAKPTLAYDYDWMPEFIEDGVHGALVPVRDVAGLARTAAAWLESPTLVDRLGHAASDKVQAHFRRDQALENERRVYESLLKPNNGTETGTP